MKPTHILLCLTAAVLALGTGAFLPSRAEATVAPLLERVLNPRPSSATPFSFDRPPSWPVGTEGGMVRPLPPNKRGTTSALDFSGNIQECFII